jgi:glucose-like phosphotransferase system IIB component
MSKADDILAGLGGADNIVEIEPCITRLRTEVKDGSKVDEAALKKAGAPRCHEVRQRRAGRRRPGGGHALRGHRGPDVITG